MPGLPEFWLSCEGKAWPELPEVMEAQKRQMHVGLWVGGTRSLEGARGGTQMGWECGGAMEVGGMGKWIPSGNRT